MTWSQRLRVQGGASYEVCSITCFVLAPVDRFSGKTVVVEGLEENRLGAACRLIDTCEVTDGTKVHVLVANGGARAIDIPPHTKLANMVEVVPRVDLDI